MKNLFYNSITDFVYAHIIHIKKYIIVVKMGIHLVAIET